MEIHNSRRAWRDFVMRRSPVDHFMEPTLPDDPGPIHAVLYGPSSKRGDPTVKSPAELTDIHYVEWGERPEAACGLRVRVVDVRPFVANEAGVCPRCRELAILQRDDPAQYRHVLQEREGRRREREVRRLAQWEADLAEYGERQHDDE